MHFTELTAVDAALRLREQFIRDIMSDNLVTDSIGGLNQYYGLHLKPYRYNIIILRLRPHPEPNGDDLQTALTRLQKLWQTQLEPLFQETVTYASGDLVVCFFNLTFPLGSEPMHRFRRVILDTYSECGRTGFSGFRVDLSAGIPVDSITALPRMYRRVLSTLGRGAFDAPGTHYDCNEIMPASENLSDIVRPPVRQSLIQALEGLNLREYMLRAAGLFAENRAVLEQDSALLLSLADYCLDLCMTVVVDHLLASGEFFHQNMKYKQRIWLQSTYEGVLRETQDALWVILDDYQRAVSGKSSFPIAAIYRYLNQNYATSISLADLSRAVGMNHQYLCALFRKETGHTIMEQLRSIRMEHAELLLRETSNSIQEIAQAVGYPNYRYFSRIFRQKNGVSPSQYRQNFYRGLPSPENTPSP